MHGPRNFQINLRIRESQLTMSRINELKKLDINSRNKLRSILTSGGDSAIFKLTKLRSRLRGGQLDALERILVSDARTAGATPFSPFPKYPPFKDNIRTPSPKNLSSLLDFLENSCKLNRTRISKQISSLKKIDESYAKDGCMDSSIFTDHISQFGWSHALLRRVVLVRENSDSVDDVIEGLVSTAGLKNNNIIVTSLIQAFSADQNYLIVKRATLNIADKGNINRLSRSISRLIFQPFAKDTQELFGYLSDIYRCSLLDAMILIQFNSHLVEISQYEELKNACVKLSQGSAIDEIIKGYLENSGDGEDLFLKQCGSWLEYPIIRSYRILIDNFFDASRDIIEPLHPDLSSLINEWVGKISIEDIVGGVKITKHSHEYLSELEASGTVTRSAIFNFWLYETEGQIDVDRNQLLTLMGITRDLSRTVPIDATRMAMKLSGDEQVKLVLLLLLAKRSKNEKDHYQLRRLLEKLSKKLHAGSLVDLIISYEAQHPYISEYIYEIATEDFLAKCNEIAPHLSDIPEIRAKLHEWMAKFSKNEFYLERARAVRIDHQLNRVRNEIDDHRIYVDPSRFSSWINDEIMLDLNGALTVVGTGKKTSVINCDDILVNLLVQQAYSAFCANPVFGIASYIGRRIRHGTFHGHLYSGVINHLEDTHQFRSLRRDQVFCSRWLHWKGNFESEVNQIINERLHVTSKQKPLGLLQPDNYSPHKLEILAASVRAVSSAHAETKTTEGIDQTIIDYCWRLAEVDLFGVVTYLKSRQVSLKNVDGLDELISGVDVLKKRFAQEFKREAVHFIDTKLRTMYGWFKRPSNISPRANLALLYDAVVAEVKDTFPSFNPRTESSDLDDIELIGGAYHVLYDSFYVVVFNAAKHGDPSKPVKRRFSILVKGGKKHLEIEISNAIRFGDNACVELIVQQRKKADHSDANLYEKRSGIPKLMQLAHTRKEFYVDFLGVVENELIVRFSYELDH